ncbi:hypothetical protein POM88_026765 [Heracleum sosnowskyi]|uniref:Replication protein A 70 kDa DNA-binding subunit B/D first OB fold domain-containing protein n=1 Tax=Heracleum sosnowskyi TaxID=360622 RepID=A0AAD8I7P5_9APIA|nr:hypothetical protein POM88_026765 [Heracleum sosnowskyi]
MSTNRYESLRNVCKGRTDWKIKVRVIREWRGRSVTGEVFKNYNMLLLDAKNCRMQAFVPAFLNDKMQKMFTIGKIYAVTNFQVKDLTSEDKWRSVNMDRQILFTNQTKAREILENEVFIQKNMFDFFELQELAKLAEQNLYLADVVGVVIKRDRIRDVKSRNGKDQLQVRMKITDGKTKINVIFWDTLAEEFQNAIDTQNLEYPLILIVSSGKVGKWKEEIDISNFSPTFFYINYPHHSVLHLRKMAQQGKFANENFIPQTKKVVQMFTVNEIRNLSEEYIDEEVICQVTIKDVQEIPKWYYSVCTSCYKQSAMVDGNDFCSKCNRIIPYPDKRFGICVLASDNTGSLEIVMMDRPIRTILAKRVYQLEEEYNKQYPTILKTLQGGDYTMKLMISKENIENKEELFLATDIFRGFKFEEPSVHEETLIKATEQSMGEQSGSTYQLDNMSELKY